MLDALPLSPRHRQHLKGKKRRLTDRQIRRHRYRTMPRGGRTHIARKLVDMFGEKVCATVPGLYKRYNAHGEYWDIAGRAGIVCPVRDAQRRFVGLQIRPEGR